MYVQEVLAQLVSKLLYKMGQDFLEGQYKDCLITSVKYKIEIKIMLTLFKNFLLTHFSGFCRSGSWNLKCILKGNSYKMLSTFVIKIIHWYNLQNNFKRICGIILYSKFIKPFYLLGNLNVFSNMEFRKAFDLKKTFLFYNNNFKFCKEISTREA